jgi:hypothetical protein
VPAAVVAGALLLAGGRASALWQPVVAAPAAPPTPEPAAPAAPSPAEATVAAFPTVTARVRALELTARAEPRRDAPVLHTFEEGEALCVSRDEAEGFRRVVLPDNRVAFVASAGLALGADAGGTKAPAAAIEAAPPVADVTHVRDLDELARVVRIDDGVSPMIRHLERREITSDIVVAGGLAAGAGLMLWGVSNDSNDMRRALVLTGAIVGLAGPIVGWILSPGRSDLQRVVKTWNDRHPTEPLALE